MRGADRLPKRKVARHSCSTISGRWSRFSRVTQATSWRGDGAMKPHVIVTLEQSLNNRTIPFWRDAIANPAGTNQALSPSIGQLLEDAGLGVVTTREFKPAAEQWDDAERAAGLDRVFRLVLKQNGAVPEAIISNLEYLPEVRSARVGKIGAFPLNLALSRPFASRFGPVQEAISLPMAHRTDTGDDDVRIAVLDTGIDLKHAEFAGRLLPGRDFVDIIDGAADFVGDFLDADAVPDDEVGHGTHVAGLAAGAGKDMPTGVAPKSSIIPVRVLAAMRKGNETVGAGLVDNINAGVKFAVDAGATIINMSLGVQHDAGGLPHESVIRYAIDKGVIVVAAAGNDGQHELYYPGALPGVVAVGSVDARGDVSSFSTYGPHVWLVAPGEDVFSSLPGGYGVASGTSHAAPLVSGTLALMQSAARKLGRTLSVGQQRHILKHSSDRIGRSFRDARGGFGRLNAADALRMTQLAFS